MPAAGILVAADQGGAGDGRYRQDAVRSRRRFPGAGPQGMVVQVLGKVVVVAAGRGVVLVVVVVARAVGVAGRGLVALVGLGGVADHVVGMGQDLQQVGRGDGQGEAQDLAAMGACGGEVHGRGKLRAVGGDVKRGRLRTPSWSR
ncbi:MAG: hypothetical protein LC667_07715 [Thioalkalivibrio sp.]|nr:hypothetical protein [Thioalkalivibrio sp.]